MPEFKALASVKGGIIPVVLTVISDTDICLRVGETIFPLAYDPPYDVTGAVSWTLPSGPRGSSDINMTSILIRKLPSSIAKMIEQQDQQHAAGLKQPSAKHFSAGSKAGNAIVAAAVKYAVDVVRNLTLVDDELSAVCAYLIVRSSIDRMVDDHPTLGDAVVHDAIWCRVGWEFLGTQDWTQETEWSYAVELLAKHGHRVAAP